MNTNYSVCKIVLINLFFCQGCMAKSIFEPLWAYFSKPSYEQHAPIKELKIPANGTLRVLNTDGNISIKEWNQETVQLKVTKLAFKEELLAKTSVDAHSAENMLTLATHHKTADHTTVVHYELIVPHNTNVQVETGNGSCSIEKLNGQIKVLAHHGNITIYDVAGPIDATSTTGTINIRNVQGNIRAETTTGNITIQGTHHTVVAKTKCGKITTECSTVASLDTILLNAQTGDINLALPYKTNADLQARTNKGSLTCDHFVTIKPYTTQLNKKTWSRLKKEVAGTLGTGEATIKLSAGTGNINITQIQA